MSATATTSVRGADAVTIARLGAWEKKRDRWQPEIVMDVWRETQLDPRIKKFWSRIYAWCYPAMLKTGAMADLCGSFKRLGCHLVEDGWFVLDAGTGNAWMARALLDLSSTTKVVCADWCPHLLRQAQANLSEERYKGRASLWRIDLTAPWPWSSDRFDAIMANNVLPYLPLGAQIALLEQAHDALRPGGVFLVNYMRAGFNFRDTIHLRRLFHEFLAEPLAFLKALPIVPAFTMRVDSARKEGLVYDFSDPGFSDVVKKMGYSEAIIVKEMLEGGIPTWLLIK